MEHVPVLLKEVLSQMKIRPGMTVVDATLGAGGYARALAKLIAPEGTLIALDRDPEAVEAFSRSLEQNPINDVYVKIFHANYSQLGEILDELGKEKVDGIVADLGISSDQLVAPERGLSFLRNEPLDMRLDRSENGQTASDIANTWSEKDIAKILQEFSQESHARVIAHSIVTRRTERPILTTNDLVECVECVVRKEGKIHPATKTFQAFRIAVNQELQHLDRFIQIAIERLAIGGRLAIVSFHSGEDRQVKEAFRTNARGCICPTSFPICRCGRSSTIQQITRKPICPSKEEIRVNPRSRSAKLRVVERI